MTAAVATADRQQLLFLGKECHHPSCHLNDFLPFYCPACHQTFCQPHFLPSQHSCTAPLPASMVDRIAPKCPMCNELVATSSSSPSMTLQPNEAVERHILSGTCAGLEGGEMRKREELKRKKDKGEVCWRKGCVKHLVVPMRCEQCRHVFCPSHRHSSEHMCGAAPSSSTPTTQLPAQAPRQGAKTALSRLLPSSTPASASKPSKSKQPPPSPSAAPRPVTASVSPLDAKAAAAAAALKRAGQDVKVPFVKSKTEKRSQDELQSTIQALKTRHDKGLLTRAEEVKYAELVGKKESTRRKGDKGDGCIIC